MGVFGGGQKVYVENIYVLCPLIPVPHLTLALR